MQYSLKQEQSPASEPITLAQSKLFLRIDHSDEDSLINDLIATARESAQQYMRRSLITQQWKMSINVCDILSQTSNLKIALPMGDVSAIISVKNIAIDATETTIASSSYHLSAGNKDLILDNIIDLTSSGILEIIYSAGFGASTDIPYSIKQGLMTHLSELYNCRDSQDIPVQSRTLYGPYRAIKL